MRQSGKNQIVDFEKEEQRSIEFSEYPELHQYYSSRMKSQKKPTKIILTEIYSPSQEKENAYFAQTKSFKNVNSSNGQIYSNYQQNEFHNYNNYGYDDNSSSKVDIRKRIYSNTPEALNRNIDEENCLENFKYYERKNIREKSNPKYESITRVIGYSNLIPVQNQQVVQNRSSLDINLNKFKKYQNKETERKVITEKNYIISKTNKKIEQNYRIKKEQTTPSQQIVKKEFKKPSQLDNNKRSQLVKKYEITKKQEIKTKTGNDYKQYERKKKEETKKEKENITQIKKTETKTKKYEVPKKQNIVNKSKEKKEVKEPQIIKRKENIKKEFTVHSGRYSYKDNIANDIINSRKNYNKNSVEKNLKRITVVQNNSKSKSQGKDKDKKNMTNKTNINKTNYKINKEEKTKKISTNINKKINVNPNMSNYKRKINETNKVQGTNIKSKINVQTESYGKIDMSKYKQGNNDMNKMVNMKEMNELFETKIRHIRNNTPKLKTINFGDNYRFYERKYLQSPDDSCFTVHHLRSQKVKYESGDLDMNELDNIKAYKTKQYLKERRYNNQMNYSMNNNDYENEDYYYEQDQGYYY